MGYFGLFLGVSLSGEEQKWGVIKVAGDSGRGGGNHDKTEWGILYGFNCIGMVLFEMLPLPYIFISPLRSTIFLLVKKR